MNSMWDVKIVKIFRRVHTNRNTVFQDLHGPRCGFASRSFGNCKTVKMLSWEGHHPAWRQHFWIMTQPHNCGLPHNSGIWRVSLCIMLFDKAFSHILSPCSRGDSTKYRAFVCVCVYVCLVFCCSVCVSFMSFVTLIYLQIDSLLSFRVWKLMLNQYSVWIYSDFYHKCFTIGYWTDVV